MFKINDVVVYNDGKIYTIIASEVKDFGMGPTEYFELKQDDNYTDEKNTSLFVEERKVQKVCRNLMTRKEALAFIDSIHGLDSTWITDAKTRKNKFQELVASKDPLKVASAVKSLEKRNRELNKLNKSLTITDKAFLEKFKCNICVELSIVLKIEFDEVIPFIENRIKEKLEEN